MLVEYFFEELNMFSFRAFVKCESIFKDKHSQLFYTCNISSLTYFKENFSWHDYLELYFALCQNVYVANIYTK